MRLFASFVAALSITTLMIPLLMRWATTAGLTDLPGPRKVHDAPVPRVGGIAIAFGIVVPLLMFLEMSAQVRGLLSGIAVLLVFGVWDDHSNLGYRTKLFGQVLAVFLCMMLGDVAVRSLTFTQSFELPEFAAYLLAAFFLIGVTNAVNLSDGLDGLAGGMALLCCTGTALFAIPSGNFVVLGIAVLAAGATLGFLRYNSHPARVFMGDSGSQILGFTMGMLSILATQDPSSALSAALPLMLVGIPIIDTASVMVRRIRAGLSPFQGDRDHLHHRLLGLGFRHAQAVGLTYCLQLLLFLCAFLLRYQSDLIIVATFLTFAGVLLTLLDLARRRGWHVNRSGTANRAADNFAVIWRRQQWSRGLALLVATGLGLYGLLAHSQAHVVGADLGALSIVLLLMLFALRNANWSMRAVGYVAIVIAVYLDQLEGPGVGSGNFAGWVLVGLVVLAASLRLLLNPQREFRVTTLDLLVVMVALVIPNLPGSIALPENLVVGLTKAVLLLYVLESFLTEGRHHLPLQAAIVLILVLTAARGIYSWIT